MAVFGEVSGFKFSGANAYFTLKDSEACISCSLFGNRRTYTPKEGESVLVAGAVDYYAKTGKLSLIVHAMQPLGVGKLHLMLEERKNRLKAEGLFDDSHKKPIPPYPMHICAVTSKTGAVIRDIVRTIRLTNELINVDVIDVRVQGDTASADICSALRLVDTLAYDCIILARGGGSFEDLMPFNDEDLARTIYALNTPIISAVGHETDFSISDFVADCRSATPTAAGQLVAWNTQEVRRFIREGMNGGYQRIAERVRQQGEQCARHIEALSSRMDKCILSAEAVLRSHASRLDGGIDKLLLGKETILDKLLLRLQADNPVRLLKGGYCKITKDGRDISYPSIQIGDAISIVTHQGRIMAEVIDKQDGDPLDTSETE